MIDAFRRAGHEVEEMGLTAEESISMGGESRFWKRLFDVLPSPLIELFEYAYSLPAAFWLWMKTLRRRPDFIYERYALGNFAGVLAARMSRLPVLLEVNSPLALEMRETGRLRFGWLARASERFILKWSTHVLVVSAALKKIYVDQGVAPERLVVIHNGIDPGQYENRNGSVFRERYGLTGSVVIGFVGFFREWHQLHLVLSLLDGQLSDPNIKLMLVGDGPVRQELEKVVEERKLGDRVVWTGILKRDQVPDALAATDIALQSAVTGYSSPLKLFEYMASGRAVVAPRLSNILEIIKEEETGLLFEPDNLDEMGAALSRLVSDDKLRERLGKAARRHIEEGAFTWDANAARVLGLIVKA